MKTRTFYRFLAVVTLLALLLPLSPSSSLVAQQKSPPSPATARPTWAEFNGTMLGGQASVGGEMARVRMTMQGAASEALIFVDLRDHGPDPETAITLVGQSVVWTNNGTGNHTITERSPVSPVYLPIILHGAGTSGAQSTGATTLNLNQSPAFDSGTIAPGEQFTHTFTTTGTFAYYSRYDPEQVVGTVAVVEASEIVTEMVQASLGVSMTTPSGVGVEIGPGALLTDTVLTVSTVPSAAIGDDPNPGFGPIYYIELDREDAIAEPITLTLPYDPGALPEGIKESDLRAFYFNGSSWIFVPSVVDSDHNTIVVTTTHLSWWEFGNLCRPFGGDVFSEAEQAAYEEARNYFRALSAHRDLFDVLTTSEGDKLFEVRADEAKWLAGQRMCDLDDHDKQDIWRELKIDAKPIDIARAMVEFGQGLQAQEYDSLQVQEMYERLAFWPNSGVLALELVKLADVGLVAGGLPFVANFAIHICVHGLIDLLWDIAYCIEIYDDAMELRNWMQVREAKPVGSSNMPQVGGNDVHGHRDYGWLNPCDYDYGSSNTFFLNSQIYGEYSYINLYDPGLSIYFVVGLQELGGYYASPLNAVDRLLILLEYEALAENGVDVEKRVAHLMFDNASLAAVCPTGKVELPNARPGTPVKATYYFIDNGSLVKKFPPKSWSADTWLRHNQPPNTPSNPSPSDNATNQSLNVDLSWSGSDPDGDSVTYDVYFEADDNTPDVLVSDGQSGTTYDLSTLSPNTHYYWQIVAHDEHAATTEGPVWDFTTGSGPNNPPNTPSSPSPSGGATNQSLNVGLSWIGSDPDGDSVTYDVYFEADDNTPDVLVSDGQSGTTYDPGTLSPNTHYYWRIVAQDEHGATTEGPVWDFTTGEGGGPIPEMVYIPAGTFQMGCDSSNPVEECMSREQPLHTVYLDAYNIDKYEVTNAEYRECVEADACSLPASSNYGNSAYDYHPVENVTWYQANDYCSWAGKRLPTEAEWEKAARGGSDTRMYPWGNESPDCSRLNYNNCVGGTSQVGNYPSGQSPYGVMDMAGNVAEWVNDWYQENYYSVSPPSNPPGPAYSFPDVIFKISRGGIYYYAYHYSRIARREFNGLTPEHYFFGAGFRCAGSPE